MNDPFGFTQAITTKEVKLYKAYMEMPDGRIGITPVHTKGVLEELIKEAEGLGNKLLKIEEVKG